MLTASGISFGFKKTLPHKPDIPFGFGIHLALCAYGPGTILLYAPVANFGLKLFGTAYLLYLAWSLRTNIIININSTNITQSMTFFNAALFQFANSKTWVMAVTGASIFILPYQSFLLLLVFGVSFFALLTYHVLGCRFIRFRH